MLGQQAISVKCSSEVNIHIKNSSLSNMCCSKTGLAVLRKSLTYFFLAHTRVCVYFACLCFFRGRCFCVIERARAMKLFFCLVLLSCLNKIKRSSVAAKMQTLVTIQITQKKLRNNRFLFAIARIGTIIKLN